MFPIVFLVFLYLNIFSDLSSYIPFFRVNFSVILLFVTSFSPYSFCLFLSFLALVLCSFFPCHMHVSAIVFAWYNLVIVLC